MNHVEEKEKKYNRVDKTNWITIKEASRLTGISPQTLRNLADTNEIQSYRMPSGQRRFGREFIQSMCYPGKSNLENQLDKQSILYARVSSQKQVDDLQRQIIFLRSSNPKYASYSVVSDVGSGLNFKRQGLSKILDLCLQRLIKEVVCAHKDRLSRFAFDLFDSIITKSGGKLTVLNTDATASTEQELAEDILSIAHVYSCRQMGRRKYKRRKPEIQNTKGETPIVNCTERDNDKMDEHE